ncbi:MAG: hypothetical protein JRH20_21680, partial [Deltaproteobacteria bacterium]|nr:hypothetical protein [Deltaproteobacteria bacterium]
MTIVSEEAQCDHSLEGRQVDNTEPHVDHRARVGQAVEADSVRLLCTQAWTGSIANIVAALIVLALMLPAADHKLVAAMPYLGVVVVYIMRLLRLRSFRRRPPHDDEMPRWRRYMFLSSLLSGNLWGSAGLFVLPQVDLPRQLFLV